MRKEKIEMFHRCIYCFAPMEELPDRDEEEEFHDGGPSNVPCPVCGYQNGLCLTQVWWLAPGTLLKGWYIVGRLLKESETELEYLGWDLKRGCTVEVHECYPRNLLQRDNTLSEQVNCLSGREQEFEQEKQRFFEKAKFYYQCVRRVEKKYMDFFARNNTCYYVRDQKKELPR